MPPNRYGVLFDIDGTLCDTNYLHTLAWSRALRDAGHDIPMAVLHRHIGMGSDKFTEAVAGERVETAIEAHSNYYRELWPEVRAFDGAKELLAAVRDRGAVVILATSAGPGDVEMLRDVLDSDDAVSAVTGAGDVESSKPDPDIFATALGAGDLDASRAIVVGDTNWDVEAARIAGLSCVAVRTGGWGTDELISAGASGVYDGPRHLLDQLDNSPLAQLWSSS